MKKIKTNKHVHKIPSFDKKDTYIGEHRNKKNMGKVPTLFLMAILTRVSPGMKKSKNYKN